MNYECIALYISTSFKVDETQMYNVSNTRCTREADTYFLCLLVMTSGSGHHYVMPKSSLETAQLLRGVVPSQQLCSTRFNPNQCGGAPRAPPSRYRSAISTRFEITSSPLVTFNFKTFPKHRQTQF